MAVFSVTADNFEQEVLDSSRPVLLDFWASWCGPCRMVAPILDELSAEMPEIRIGKVNVDEQPALAEAFRVTGIPMLVVMKNGRPVAKTIGAQPKEHIRQLLNSAT